MALIDHLPAFPRGRTSPRRLFEQALVLGAVVGVIAWLAASTAANLESRGIATGFNFLWQPARLGISESWIVFVPGVDTYARVVAIGLINTLLVSALAIVISTVIGVIVGLSRLSSNWLQSRCAGAFVELVRNVPLPLQLLLWYQVLLNLPAPRNALSLFDAVRLSNRGLFLPTVVWTPTLTLVLLGLALGICGLVTQARMARGRGAEPLLSPLRAALALGLALSGGLAFGAVDVDVPVLRGFNFQGGLVVSPELAALVLGLSLYAAAFTAEIVRAGILAVPLGQWEAGKSLGLRQTQILRKIVMPLSLRLTIPPLASEYLSTIKNSSLAVVIGYPELTSLINTMLSDTGQPIEAITILMLAYLTISVSVSSLMNWYERRTALVTR